MSARPYSASLVLGCALALGVAGDVLLRAPVEPALNLFLWIAAVAVAAVLLHRRSRPMSGESLLCIAIAVSFAAGLTWRDAPALKLVALGAAAVCLALPAYRAGAAWLRSIGIASYIAAVIASGAHAVFGVVLVLTDIDWDRPRRDPATRGRLQHAGGIARGTAIAVPLIVVFGALFISADAVFAGMVADIVRIDLELLASHVAPIVGLTVVSAGYLRRSLRGPMAIPLNSPRPLLSLTEVGTALGLLGVLFAVFVGVQFRYLFGGSALIEVTPGLTYAEYARRGFFELVAVVALMLPLLLLADWVLRRDAPRDELRFRMLAGAQIVLVLAILASALQRMRLYQATYGLTELRFYVTATLILLGVVLVWFSATVLRGRRERFAFGALAATLTAGVLLFAANPDAVIARTNIARNAEAVAGDPRLDIAYATSLSADAVPVLLSSLPELTGEERCAVATGLLKRWLPESPAPLRGWNWSAARARDAVGRREQQLRAACA